MDKETPEVQHDIVCICFNKMRRVLTRILTGSVYPTLIIVWLVAAFYYIHVKNYPAALNALAGAVLSVMCIIERHERKGGNHE